MNLFHTHISPESIELVNQVLKSGFINQGPMVEQLEKELGQHGLKNPVTVNCGTSALHLALVLNNIGPGDEVVLPAQTFVATGLVVLMCGATPVFADIDENGSLRPDTLHQVFSDRTQAIIAVHWGGFPADMREIQLAASAHPNKPVIIEDAAHAFGSSYKGIPIGSVSDYTAFSFQAIKLVTAADGGVLCVPDDKLQEAKRRRWFGMCKNTPIGPLGDREQNIKELGYKWHMNDLNSALALGNLRDVKERLAQRYNNVQMLKDGLGDLVRWQRCGYGGSSSNWLFTIFVPDRDDFIRAVKSRGVPASVVDRRIDSHQIFGGKCDLPGQEVFDREAVCVPCHEGLTQEDLDTIIKSVKMGW